MPSLARLRLTGQTPIRLSRETWLRLVGKLIVSRQSLVISRMTWKKVKGLWGM